MSHSPSLSPNNSTFISTTHHRFRERSKDAAIARKIYFKILISGTLMTTVLIFAVFSIFWGALWKIPVRPLPGWVVDFDGGQIGEVVALSLQTSPSSGIQWSKMPASQFPNGVEDLQEAVREEVVWVALSINTGSSARLASALETPNATYDGRNALTVMAIEARNENAFRSIIRPTVQTALESILKSLALQIAQTNANSSRLPDILATSPQTIVTPVSYTLQNLVPFDMPVATAVTFVGLIYQLILSFFIVMIGTAARDQSGLETRLETRSLILLRIASCFAGYLIISLFYSLLSVAFQLRLNAKFGHAGFLVFWMFNYAGMLSVGLALESLTTLLTTKFIPFFMLAWIITNVSVCAFPIEVMPRIFRYGYAFPFYNISIGIRTVVFGTKNKTGLAFGILIIWIVASCITIPLFQYFARHRQQKEALRAHSQTLDHLQEKQDS